MINRIRLYRVYLWRALAIKSLPGRTQSTWEDFRLLVSTWATNHGDLLMERRANSVMSKARITKADTQ